MLTHRQAYGFPHLNIMTIEEMKERRKALGLTYEQLADRTGVPLGTLQKIFSGITRSPRYDTLLALEKVLRVKEGKDLRAQPGGREWGAGVSEDGIIYGEKRQGEYTLEDYYRIPDERRVELIDGVIYDMVSPMMIHQLIMGQIYAQLLACIKEKGLDCIPFMAPADVQLDCDDRTMLQPDIFVVCDRSRIKGRNLFGAPDFVVEVLSKSTRRKDMNLKCEKYRKAGVKEYWLVDPDRKKVIVYTFGEEPDVNIYGFTDKIPVNISAGNCRIDFAMIDEYVSFLYDVED